MAILRAGPSTIFNEQMNDCILVDFFHKFTRQSFDVSMFCDVNFCISYNASVPYRHWQNTMRHVILPSSFFCFLSKLDVTVFSSVKRFGSRSRPPFCHF